MAGSCALLRWSSLAARQAADFEELEPEGLDLRERAVQRGAVRERPGQDGVAAAGVSL